jgi:HSP20 family protein
MNLIHWDPYREIRAVQDRMSRMLGSTPARGDRDEEMSLGAWMPPVDIVEEKDQITLTAELPGFKEDQVEIQVENGVMTLKGERRFEEKKEGKNYHRVERSYGQFVRSFTLPNNVDRESIRANFSDGLLRVELPKREEAKPRQIKIGGAGSSRKAIDVQTK